MQKENEKFSDSCIFEGMTSIRAVLQASDAGSLSGNDRKITQILYNCERLSSDDKTIYYLHCTGDRLGFSVDGVSAEEIDKLALGTSHGGIIAYCTGRTIPHLSITDIRPDGYYCMIQGIEDPYNFGYSLRSLYACGATGIILPERNWMTAAGVVARSSAGASELFPLYMSDALECADLFHRAGYRIVCADLRTDDVLYNADLHLPLLLLIGGERRGISRDLLETADLRVKIPYGRTFGASLSAASASTIVGYEIFRQNADALSSSVIK